MKKTFKISQEITVDTDGMTIGELMMRHESVKDTIDEAMQKSRIASQKNGIENEANLLGVLYALEDGSLSLAPIVMLSAVGVILSRMLEEVDDKEDDNGQAVQD